MPRKRDPDAVVVVAGVGLEVGVPLDLLGVHDLTVHDRGAFAVTAAEIETDTAAVEMTTERNGGDFFFRNRIDNARGDCHRFEKNPPADDVAVEGAVAPRHVEAGNFLRHLRVTTDDDSRSAFHPQQELDDSLDVFEVEWDIFTLVRGNPSLMPEHRAIGPCHGNDQGRAPGVDFRPRLIGLIPEHGRNKIRIENRPVLRLHHQPVHGFTSLSGADAD
jgi:hypothetical protein